MTITVAVFVGTRADLGPLSPVLQALAAAPDMELQILTGVAYSPEELAATLPQEPEAIGRTSIHPVAPPITDASSAAITDQGAKISREVPAVLGRIGAKVVVVLGDRWELLYVIPPAFLLGIPIVHLHGGEVTGGAIDERVRHAISKLADQHCVASQDAAARLRQMGEEAERIHHTGAPGLDRISRAQPFTDVELGDLLNIEVVRPVALFTYHAPTAEEDAPVGAWARGALQATRGTCNTVIVTYPGHDRGREQIIDAISDVGAKDHRVVLVESLGKSYPRVLSSVDVVVGNSSSGIIEAGSVPLPVVNVGNRQQGRLRGSNVIDTAEGERAVANGVKQAVDPEFRAAMSVSKNPYGTGEASERILEVIRGAVGRARAKRFVDMGKEGQ